MSKAKVNIEEIERSSYFKYVITVDDDHYITGYIRWYTYKIDGLIPTWNGYRKIVRFIPLNNQQLIQQIKDMYYWLEF